MQNILTKVPIKSNAYINKQCISLLKKEFKSFEPYRICYYCTNIQCIMKARKLPVEYQILKSCCKIFFERKKQ